VTYKPGSFDFASFARSIIEHLDVAASLASIRSIGKRDAIGAALLALTPISPFRPRRWRGALLPDGARVRVEVLEAEKRPVAAVADHDEVRDVLAVDIQMDHGIGMHMLFDPGHNLDERIVREQFGY